MSKFVPFILLLCWSGLALAQFSSLEERMTAAEFRQAGLDKLSDEELITLNNWIRGHSLGALEGGAAAQAESGGVEGDRRGFSDFRGEATPIVARIKGEFNGWSGETVFELDNGMIWEQADQSRQGVPTRQNPEITIEPGFLSSWYLTINGVNQRVRVTRVQ
ncbi:MAG: hypothetical protein Tsb002_17420 [Wenzhouxiangellaceae bacterium]